MWDTRSLFEGDITSDRVYDFCVKPPAEMLLPFLNVVRNSHKIEVRVSVAESNGGYMSWCDSAWRAPTWHMASGDISESLSDEVTRTFNMNAVADYWTSDADVVKDLSPYKTMLRVERGIYTGQGIIYAPLGIYRVHSTKVTNGKNALITAYSQEADIRDHRFLNPPGVTAASQTFESLFLPAGALFGDMGSIAPTVEWIGPNMNSVAGRSKILPAQTMLTTGRNRLELIKRLVASLNADFYFTRTNRLIIRDKPEFSDTVQLRVNAARADMTPDEPAILVSFDKQYTRNAVYNAVVATATDTAGTVSYRAVAYDTDPASPTRWNGPFGRKPRFFASPFLRSNAECASAADKILLKALELKSSLNCSFIPNPLIEIGDVIELAYSNGAVETHVIDKLSLGLVSSGAMSASTAADSDTQAEIQEM